MNECSSELSMCQCLEVVRQTCPTWTNATFLEQTVEVVKLVPSGRVRWIDERMWSGLFHKLEEKLRWCSWSDEHNCEVAISTHFGADRLGGVDPRLASASTSPQFTEDSVEEFKIVPREQFSERISENRS